MADARHAAAVLALEPGDVGGIVGDRGATVFAREPRCAADTRDGQRPARQTRATNSGPRSFAATAQRGGLRLLPSRCVGVGAEGAPTKRE